MQLGRLSRVKAEHLVLAVSMLEYSSSCPNLHKKHLHVCSTHLPGQEWCLMFLTAVRPIQLNRSQPFSVRESGSLIFHYINWKFLRLSSVLNSYIVKLHRFHRHTCVGTQLHEGVLQGNMTQVLLIYSFPHNWHSRTCIQLQNHRSTSKVDLQRNIFPIFTVRDMVKVPIVTTLHDICPRADVFLQLLAVCPSMPQW